MTNDGTELTTAVYDAENRIASATRNGVSTSYVYDADGNPVKKSSGRVAQAFSRFSVLQNNSGCPIFWD
jgi:YD repeat-containing protein